MANLKEWKIPNDKIEIPASLTAAGYTPLLAVILAKRGILDPEEADSFLAGDPGLLQNCLTLPDMSAAVRRITRAREACEKIAVYGDYDVDGITASCLLANYFRSLALDCEIYIPDRINEGYGLNRSAIEALHDRGITLIVTVDCGVTAVEETEYASSLGVDIIITDHHEPLDVLPNADAVVDPKRTDSDYPNHLLAGVGVAFKLACAIDGVPERILERYSDLVAVGTIADIIPITGENRYIIKSGLTKLLNAPSPGLAALIEECGICGRKLSATSIGFALTPRLNAAGRLGKVKCATDLLMTTDSKTAASIASDLCDLNRERQALEQATWKQALELLGEAKPDTPIVLASDTWHQGVIGIVASRLSEAFSVPAIMICFCGDKGKGSCRSFGDFNLFEALSACSDWLDSFGGHCMAAGLNIQKDNVDGFRAAISEYYRQHPPTCKVYLEPELRIDDPALLSLECVESLDMLEPCGSGNPRPLLCMTDALLTAISPIGGGRHLRMNVSHLGVTYECVFFSHTQEELGIRAGDHIDLAFCPQINDFRSRRSVQLMVNDIRRHDFSVLCDTLLSGIPPLRDCHKDICPDRSDFAWLWRRMMKLGGRFSGTVPEMLDWLNSRIHPGCICVCMLVFNELDLLDLEYKDKIITLRAYNDGRKVDLDSSQILKTLCPM